MSRESADELDGSRQSRFLFAIHPNQLWDFASSKSLSMSKDKIAKLFWPVRQRPPDWWLWPRHLQGQESSHFFAQSSWAIFLYTTEFKFFTLFLFYLSILSLFMVCTCIFALLILIFLRIFVCKPPFLGSFVFFVI